MKRRKVEKSKSRNAPAPRPGGSRQSGLFPAGGSRGRKTGSDAAGSKTLTVTELTRMVKAAIHAGMPETLHLVGEISNFTRSTNGHLYFTLKDADAEVRCVMWRSSAASVRFDPADGLEVVATGFVDVYEPRGQYQFYARRLEPRGVGALELAFRQLKERLAGEGLFDPGRKRPLPRFPERIAVVTSATGAAIRDIIKTVSRRYPVVELLIHDVRVQGDGAAEEIAAAIRRINRRRARLGGVDVMIVGRGGGSLEDLWAFNEEVVARAIFASDIPIVSAVGHEIDFTIADFVADVRAATPTAAAERVVPSVDELLGDLDGRAHRLTRGIRAALDAVRARLSAVERFEWFRDPVGRVRHRQQEVDEVGGRLQLAMSRGQSTRQAALHEFEVRLARVRPEGVLARRREGLSRMERRLGHAEQRLSLRLERRLGKIDARLMAASPIHAVERGSSGVGQLLGRLERGMRIALADRRRAIESLDARLAAAGHEQVLARGFSITRRKKTREIVTDPRQLREGDRITTRVAEGEFDSKVVDRRQGELFE